jgi:hypothetical protein
MGIAKKTIGTKKKINLPLLSCIYGTENRKITTSLFLEMGCWMTLSVDGDDRVDLLKLVHKKLKFWLFHNLRSLADYKYYLLDCDWSDSITRNVRPANNAHWINDITLILKKPVKYKEICPEIIDFMKRYETFLIEIAPEGVEFHKRRKDFKPKRTEKELSVSLCSIPNT